MKEEIFGFWNKFNWYLTDSSTNCTWENKINFISKPPKIKELSEDDLIKKLNLASQEEDLASKEEQDILINIYDFKSEINKILDLGNNIKFNNWVIITWLNDIREKVSLIIKKFDFLPLVWVTEDWNTIFSLNIWPDNLFYIDGDNLWILDFLVNSLQEKWISIQDVKKIYIWSLKYQHLNVNEEQFKEFHRKLDNKIWISKISNIDDYLDWLWVLNLTLFIQLIFQAYWLNFSKICRYYKREENFKEDKASLVLERKKNKIND